MKKLILKMSPTRISAIFILAFAALTLVSRFLDIFKLGGHNWGVGEWLINYNGGFVRRGFTGQIFLSLFDSKFVVLIFLFVFQFFLIIYVSIFVFQKFLQQNNSWWGLALALNPAGLLAIVWDSNLLIRKEWLGLALLVWLAKKDMGTYPNLKFSLLILGFSASLLSSEVNFAFLIPIIYLLLDSGYKSSLLLKQHLVGLISISFSILILILIFHGDSIYVSHVCDLIKQNGLSPETNCQGAVSALALSLSDALGHFRSDYPGYFLYIILFFLALIPIFTSSWFSMHKGWASGILLGVFPLFFVAWDYGRWIFILVVSITVCMGASGNSKSSFDWRWYQSLAFICLWGVSHGGNPATNGVISLAGSLFRSILKLV